MTRTITGSYDASLQIRTDKDDLIASGIERDFVEILNGISSILLKYTDTRHGQSGCKNPQKFSEKIR